MAVIEPKCKMISFRLSAAEYAEAERVCRSRRCRSLSLFARTALLEYVSDDGHASRAEELDERDLRSRVEQLAAELKRVTEYVSTAVKSAGAGGNS